jgi:hypothetical protein
LIDNTFVQFGGVVCQQNAGIPMGINSAPSLVDLFLNAYKAYFLQVVFKDYKERERERERERRLWCLALL